MKNRMLTTVLSMTMTLVSGLSYAMYADGVKIFSGERFENIRNELHLSSGQIDAIEKINASHMAIIQQKRLLIKEARTHIEAMFATKIPTLEEVQPHIQTIEKLYGEILVLRVQERIQVDKQLNSEQIKQLGQLINKWTSENPEKFSEI